MATRAADPTAAFFAELATRSHDPLLRKASGATRFDIVDGRRVRRWYLDIDKGDISVATKASGDTSCVTPVALRSRGSSDRVASSSKNAAVGSAALAMPAP